jgi:hypothetical protein
VEEKGLIRHDLPQTNKRDKYQSQQHTDHAYTISTNLHFYTDQGIADSAEENARIVAEEALIISLQLSAQTRPAN